MISRGTIGRVSTTPAPSRAKLGAVVPPEFLHASFEAAADRVIGHLLMRGDRLDVESLEILHLDRRSQHRRQPFERGDDQRFALLAADRPFELVFTGQLVFLVDRDEAVVREPPVFQAVLIDDVVGDQREPRADRGDLTVVFVCEAEDLEADLLEDVVGLVGVENALLIEVKRQPAAIVMPDLAEGFRVSNGDAGHQFPVPFTPREQAFFLRGVRLFSTLGSHRQLPRYLGSRSVGGPRACPKTSPLRFAPTAESPRFETRARGRQRRGGHRDAGDAWPFRPRAPVSQHWRHEPIDRAFV